LHEWRGELLRDAILSRELLQSRVDRTLATDPANDRINNRMNGEAGGASAPFALSPDGNNTNFNTSLTQWGSAMSEADKEAIESARKQLSKDAKLPQPAKLKAPKLDLWARAHHSPFEADDTKIGDALTTYVGGDYRVDRDLLVGGLVQVDESNRGLTAGPGSIAGQAYMAGPYMAYRVTPNITVDAKTAWGVARDSAMADSASTSFATNRMLSEAGVSGSWDINKWQLSQKGAVTYVDETSTAAIPGVAGTSVDSTRLRVGPELKRQIDVGANKSIEPFVYYKKSLNMDQVGGLDLTGSQDSVGGGLTLNKPNAYQIRATPDFTETAAESIDNSVAGR